MSEDKQYATKEEYLEACAAEREVEAPVDTD